MVDEVKPSEDCLKRVQELEKYKENRERAVSDARRTAQEALEIAKQAESRRAAAERVLAQAKQVNNNSSSDENSSSDKGGREEDVSYKLEWKG